jgi:TolB protein
MLLLMLGMGRLMPRGDQVLFSSVTRWQSGEWRVYALDMNRALAQPIATSHTTTMPPLPVSWSPDGQHILYLSEQPLDSDLDRRIEAYIADAQGANRRRIAPEMDTSIYNVIWSPDGQRIAFLGGSMGREDVYIADADGLHPRSLTEKAAGYKNLMWSPDGRYLSVESSHLNEDIYVIDPDNETITNVTGHSGRDTRGAWSPDAKWLAFISSRNNQSSISEFDLYIVNPNGTGLTRLTDNQPASSTWIIRWSPDASRIAFGAMSWSGGNDIYLIDMPEKIVRNITADPAIDAFPSWSPDGKWLAFQSRLTVNNKWDIFLVDSEGENRRQLTDGPTDSRRPMWSPDSKSIIFSTNRMRLSGGLYLLTNLENQTPVIRQLTGGQRVDFWPIWKP